MKSEIITSKSTTGLRDILKSRYIIQQFIRRDFIVRYRNTYLGYVWAIANPFFQALIYVTVFGFLVRVNTSEYPTSYTVVLLLGLLVWTLFIQASEQASNVLIGNMGILKKVYFPRINLCIASIASAAMDFCIAFIVTILIFLLYGFENVELGFKLILLPVIVLGVLLLSLAIGSFLAILKVKYQDFKHIVPILFQTWFFMSPIVYTQSLIPVQYLIYYKLNPMYGYISATRWIFINGAPLEFAYLIYSCIISLILFMASMSFFSKNERQIVDSE